MGRREEIAAEGGEGEVAFAGEEEIGKRKKRVFDRIYRMDRISVGGGIFTTEGTECTERKTEETRSEEMAGRRNLRPVGGFPLRIARVGGGKS